MTIFTSGNTTQTRQVASGPQRENKVLNGVLFAFLILGIVAIAAFLGLVVFWRSEIEAMQLRVSKFDRDIRSERLLIENHQTQKDALCSWENISAKIAYYKLDLRPMETDQSIYMSRRNQKPQAFAYLEANSEDVVANDGQTSAVAGKGATKGNSTSLASAKRRVPAVKTKQETAKKGEKASRKMPVKKVGSKDLSMNTKKNF